MPGCLQPLSDTRSWKPFGNVMLLLDRYGHLFPGNDEEAAGLLDDYLERAADGVE